MTVIICPACNTRFETAAVIPPTGRKVRCSKCGNVWQAMAVVEPVKPTGITAPPAAPGFMAKPNSGALANGGPVPAPSQAPAAKRSGPLFSTDDDMQPDMGGDGSGLAGMGGNSLGGDQVRDL